MSPEAVGRTGQGRGVNKCGFFGRSKDRAFTFSALSVWQAPSCPRVLFPELHSSGDCRSPALPDTPGPRVILGTRLTKIDRVHVS